MNVTSSTPGRNVLSFKLSGSEKMRIASDGSVGIGTAAPATTLDVSGTTTLKGTTNLSNNNIISIGNAGIGTAAPAYKLDVIGSGSDNIVCRLQSGGANTYTTYVNTGASNLDVGTGSGGHFIYGYGSYPLYFGVNGSERMRITSAGNVGIGTSTPEATLQINKTGTNKGLVIDSGNQNVVALELSGNSLGWGSGMLLNNTSTNGRRYGIYSADDGTLIISSNNTPAAMISVSKEGYMGIGTNASAYPLEVITSNTVYYSGAYHSNAGNNLPAVGNTSFSARFASLIRVASGGAVYADSDIRVKNNINTISGKCSIDLINRINPVTFYYNDYYMFKNQLQYGYIAQEVKEILPEAVSTQCDYIPNFLCKIKVYRDENGLLKVIRSGDVVDKSTFSFYIFDTSNDIVSSQQKIHISIKLYDLSNNNEIICNAFPPLDTGIITDNGTQREYEYFFIEPNPNIIHDSEYFLYGQKVQDFHNLSYNTITIITTAAVKEINYQQQADKVRIAELETEIVSLKQELDKQQTLINSILERLAI
jgi:Chaperone of endosialidase